MQNFHQIFVKTAMNQARSGSAGSFATLHNMLAAISPSLYMNHYHAVNTAMQSSGGTDHQSIRS